MYQLYQQPLLPSALLGICGACLEKVRLVLVFAILYLLITIASIVYIIVDYSTWEYDGGEQEGAILLTVCDGTQNVGRYRYRYFFPVLNIFDTDTGTFFRYQIFPIPVPRLFSDTKFDRYRFRDFFPVPNFSDTGSDTTRKMKNSRYRHLNSTGTHYKSSKFLNFGNKNQFRYQIFPIPVPRLFSGTKFFRYRFRYHHKNEKFSVPVPIRYRYPL